jgi:hypothetical protein
VNASFRYRRLSTIIEDYRCIHYKCHCLLHVHTTTYIQYCLKIKTIGFQTYLVEMVFGESGNSTFFIFGGKSLWWKRVTPGRSVVFYKKKWLNFTQDA